MDKNSRNNYFISNLLIVFGLYLLLYGSVAYSQVTILRGASVYSVSSTITNSSNPLAIGISNGTSNLTFSADGLSSAVKAFDGDTVSSGVANGLKIDFSQSQANFTATINVTFDDVTYTTFQAMVLVTETLPDGRIATTSMLMSGTKVSGDMTWLQ